MGGQANNAAKPGITPFLWFDGDVEEAAKFYLSAFEDGLWAKLTAGGKESRCGWLEDRYGLSWQIVPTILIRLLRDPNPAKANAAMQAMLQMGKLDIERLQQASDQA